MGRRGYRTQALPKIGAKSLSTKHIHLYQPEFTVSVLKFIIARFMQMITAFYYANYHCLMSAIGRHSC